MINQTKKQFEYSSSAIAQAMRSHVTRPRLFHGDTDLAVAERARLRSSRLWRAAGKTSVCKPLREPSLRHEPDYPISDARDKGQCNPA